MIISTLILLGALAWIGLLAYQEYQDQSGPAAGPAAEPEQSQDEEHARLLAQPKEASNAQARLVISLDPQQGAAVGDMIKVSARVVDTSGRPVTNVLYRVGYWHIEDEKTVFGFSNAAAPEGSLSWEYAPFDGVPYEVRVTAAATPQSSVQFGSLSANPVAFVEALAPPLRVKLLSTLYLVAVVGLGVATGLWAAMSRAAAVARGRPTPRRATVAAA
jgi:hypothetical protein